MRRFSISNFIVQDVRAKPEFPWPRSPCAGSPLPGGRVDLNAAASGYTDSGSAITSGLRALARFSGETPVPATSQSWQQSKADLASFVMGATESLESAWNEIARQYMELKLEYVVD